MSIDLNKSYDRKYALDFLRDEFLPEDFEIVSENIMSLRNNNGKIEKAFLLGKTPSLDLSVYEFIHKSEFDPRVTITKETFRFLADRGEQRALAFFISENSPNYRFSLITIDLKSDGKKIEKIISNPKRFSFYLGPDAKVNTPNKYLIKKGRASDFSDLKSRFSIEVVNKEFFEQISRYFMTLAGGKRRSEDFSEGILKLPSTNEHQKKQEFAVRLIGRIIFCWFLKKKLSIQGKSLMPDELLSSVLQEKDYYHNVLEPLFFEVLNKPKEQRDKKFRNEVFDSIPFLNGGLFEPHDDDFYAPDSELKISKHINTLRIPDDWFKDLFGTLETYNFTIDENTSTDIDLSVDPEMLGRIFENLLAEINPETGETARKRTGSYYTPREIVDYMVNESLKYYLLEKTKIDEEKIDQLIHNTFDTIELNEKERNEIIDALSSLKVIDPACGSGAFMLGILQRTVSILSEVDPDSQFWMEKQLEKISDITLRIKLRQNLSREKVNYIHKLGLIQNSIYGVDIQEIAVELSKLRVFLSLVVDAYVDDTLGNRGLEPLPNLEFKFVCANSLIDLPPEKIYLVDRKIGNPWQLHVELKELSEKYFISSGEEKERIKKEFRNKQKQLFDTFNEWDKNMEDKKSFMLSEWDPFLDKPSSWFNPDWMFGIKDGFDIVIANPPYGNIIDSDLKNKLNAYYKFSTLSEIASPFIERSINLLKDKGNLIFIITYAITFSKDLSKTRYLINKTFERCDIFTFDRDRCDTFESMSQSVSIIKCFKKDSGYKQGIFTSSMFRETPDIYNIQVSNANAYLLPIGADYSLKHRLPKIGEEKNINILNRLLFHRNKMKQIIDIKGEQVWIRTSGNYWYNAWDKEPYKSSEIKPIFINRKYVNFFLILMNSSLLYYWFRLFGDGRHMNLDILKEIPIPAEEIVIKYEKLLSKVKMKFIEQLFSVFDSEKKRFITSKVKSQIDLLDLILGRFLYDIKYDDIVHIINYDSEIRGGNKLSQPFINLIDQIISLTKSCDYHENFQKQSKVKEYEYQIDRLIYEFYNFTDNEIKIIKNLV